MLYSSYVTSCGLITLTLSLFLSIFSVTSSQSVDDSAHYAYCKSGSDCTYGNRCYIIRTEYPIELITYISNSTCKERQHCRCLPNMISSESRSCFSSNECSRNETCYLPKIPAPVKSRDPGWCTPCTNAKLQPYVPHLVDLSMCSDSNNTGIQDTDQHHHIHSTCTLSAHCEIGEVCMALTHSGTFYECSRQMLNSSFVTPCFCRDYSSRGSCPVNNDHIRLLDITICIPCSSIENLSPDLPDVSTPLCQKRFPEVPAPQNGENVSSILEKCSSRQPCKSTLRCTTHRDDLLIECPKFPLDHSCFCFKSTERVCNIVQACRRGQLCVRLYGGRQFCVESGAAKRFQEHLSHINTLPWWFAVSLFATEIIFTLLKSVTVNHTKKAVRMIGGAFFVVESIAGLTMTVLQLINVMLMRNYPGVLMDLGTMVGAVLFVASEIISIISEFINVRRKIGFDPKIDSSLSKPTGCTKVSRPSNWLATILPIRRVVSKYIAIIMALVCLIITLGTDGVRRYSAQFGFATKINPEWVFIVLLTYITLHTIIFLKFKHKFWSRILSACFFLTLSATFVLYSIIIVITNHQDSYCSNDGNRRFRFEGFSTYAIFLFSASIFNSAVSGVHLKGYRETGNVTQEQVEFVEAATIGPAATIPAIICAPVCFYDRISILTVGLPQVAVLLCPILLEYAAPLWSMMTAFFIKSMAWF